MFLECQFIGYNVRNNSTREYSVISRDNIRAIALNRPKGTRALNSKRLFGWLLVSRWSY